MIDRLRRIRENCETIARDLYGVTPPVSALAREVAKLAETIEKILTRDQETTADVRQAISRLREDEYPYVDAHVDGQTLADYIESETRLASIIEADPGRDPELPAEDGA